MDFEDVPLEQSLMTFIENVRENLGMYVGEPGPNTDESNARNLLNFQSNWTMCLGWVKLNDPYFNEFQLWLDREKHGAVGPTHALFWKIEELGGEKALAWFFECFDEYKKLKKIEYPRVFKIRRGGKE